MAGLRTPIGRLAFPHLFVARAASQGQEPRYSGTILFDPVGQKAPEYHALKKAAFEAGCGMWGEPKMRDPTFFRTLRMPFRPAGEKQYEGFEDGFIFITARSKERPGVVDARLQDITVPADVWAGQLCRFFVAAFAYSNSGNNGISFALNHVQITKRDMERIDGRVAANKAFDPVVEETASGELETQDFPF